MRHIAMYHIIVAAIAVVFVGFPTASPAQIAAAQIKLTEKHVEGFIAAQRDMSAVAEKMQGSVFLNHPNAKYEVELNAVTKKHGFKNFAEYEAVAANISLVMAAIDPQTRAWPRGAPDAGAIREGVHQAQQARSSRKYLSTVVPSRNCVAQTDVGI